MAEEQPPSGYEKHRRKGRRMADLALKLTVGIVRDALTVGRQGRVCWANAAGVVGELAYAVVGPADPLPAVALRYVLPDGRRETTVRLTATRTRFGGRRAWFLCPHVRDGTTCGRRVGTLYQPEGEAHFACRACHKLSYYTSLRAHQVERLLQRMDGRDVPDAVAGVFDWLRGEGGGERKRGTPEGRHRGRGRGDRRTKGAAGGSS